MNRDYALRRMMEVMYELYNIVGHKADDTQIWVLLARYYEDVVAALEAKPPCACGGREPAATQRGAMLGSTLRDFASGKVSTIGNLRAPEVHAKWPFRDGVLVDVLVFPVLPTEETADAGH